MNGWLTPSRIQLIRVALVGSNSLSVGWIWILWHKRYSTRTHKLLRSYKINERPFRAYTYCGEEKSQKTYSSGKGYMATLTNERNIKIDVEAFLLIVKHEKKEQMNSHWKILRKRGEFIRDATEGDLIKGANELLLKNIEKRGEFIIFRCHKKRPYNIISGQILGWHLQAEG